MPLERVALLVLVTLAWGAPPALAAGPIEEASPRASEFSRRGAPPSLLAPPEVYGPGHVLREGNVRMKVANWGFLGNPFTNLSADPSGMWPDSSGIEYLHHISLAVAAKDPAPPPGVPARRVSFLREWGPATYGPEDRLYRTWQTAPNGLRFVNDDGDSYIDPATGQPVPRIDEDFLDGRDNDGDGQIDEDFGGLGYEGYSCMMRDDGPYSTPSGASPDAALGLEVRQTVWNYKVPGYEDFVAAEYRVINRSGHALDSVFVGFQVDFDAGPYATPVYFTDDRDLPGYPRGTFTVAVDAGDPQRQLPHAPLAGVSADSALCARRPVRINGFSVVDDDGDAGQTPGVATFLLLDHTIDPLGANAPPRTGFRAFRSFQGGTPWALGGNPNTDSLRWEFMSGTENVDPATGFVNATPGATAADYVAWCSVGPFRNLPDGGEVVVTVAFQVGPGNLAAGLDYTADLAAYESGAMSYADLIAAHPLVGHAVDVQLLRDGSHALDSDGARVPDFHGRETALRAPLGGPPMFVTDCRSENPRIVGDRDYVWFDFDCDYCTGVWNHPTQSGAFQYTWDMDPGLLSAPPVPVDASRGLRIVAAVPNPAGASATLTFELSRGGRGIVEILDAAGRRVRRLEERAFEAGRRSVVWDGRDAAGLRVGPGVYLWRVLVAGEMAARKVAVVE